MYGGITYYTAHFAQTNNLQASVLGRAVLDVVHCPLGVLDAVEEHQGSAATTVNVRGRHNTVAGELFGEVLLRYRVFDVGKPDAVRRHAPPEAQLRPKHKLVINIIVVAFTGTRAVLAQHMSTLFLAFVIPATDFPSVLDNRSTVAEVIRKTSCARGDTIYLRPLQVDNIFAFIRQVAPVPACWLFKTSAKS